jgi:hypothetical protein
MLEAHATLKVGSKIQFLEDLQDFGQHWITARFLTIEAPEMLVRQGHIYAPFLFNVHHSFKLETISAAKTQLTHSLGIRVSCCSTLPSVAFFSAVTGAISALMKP